MPCETLSREISTSILRVVGLLLIIELQFLPLGIFPTARPTFSHYWVSIPLFDQFFPLTKEPLGLFVTINSFDRCVFMARLAFCDYHNMVAILEKYEQNTDFYQIVDFVGASHIRYALTFNHTIYVSHNRQFWSTARIETTDEGTKILATVDGILRTVTESSIRHNLKLNDEEGLSSLPDTEGESLGTPTEPHHTPSPEAQPSSYTHISSPTLPVVITIPTVTPSETTPLRQYTRRARIAQSSAFSPIADEPASPMRDVNQGEACPTDYGFEADHDRANIAKTSTLPHESTSRVTSLATDEGTKVKFLEDRQGEGINLFGDDAPIKGRRLDKEEVATKRVSSDTEDIRLDEGEVAAEKVSDDTEEMAIILITMDAASVLSSGGVQLVLTAAAVAPANVSISTGSGVVPTASTTISTATPIFGTATTVTPYIRRKGKEKMVETHTPKKKKRLQEQIDIQFARELEEELEREAQRMNAQITRDEEIAKIHAEEELQQMIEDHHSKILQYQAQQRKTRTKKQKRDFYMAVIKNNLGWKVKDFKGMSFEEVEAKFKTVWEQIEGGVSTISEGEAAWLKRKGIRSKQESAKKQKTSEEAPEKVMSSDEVPEEKIKELIRIVPIEEVYVEALQVKHPIIDWNVHTEGQRSYWKITRLGGSSKSYQFFMDMLKLIDIEDLNQLWALVKETLSVRPATDEKEMELWVELKRLYEPDVKDHLWTHTQHIMHAPVEWRKVLALVMICYKLQVENYSQMATDLVRKIQQIAGTPSLQVTEFLLPEELPTAREDSCHCQKQREAIARKLALLSMSRRNCQSKVAVTLS
nr:hypothetical protein [Tanacetum cinerariifolium]